MSRYITRLINQGENQTLDFKHSITDSRKIARSLVAFANTHGGTLLIGVKDNGTIAGVNSDEEYYMVEAASQLYCRPVVPFTAVKWDIAGKSILEVKVRESKRKPHRAPDKTNRYRAYVRIDDENILATSLQVKIWKAEKRRRAMSLSFTPAEQTLIDYLKQGNTVTTDGYSKLAFISRSEAEQTLINLTVMGLLRYAPLPRGDSFMLANKE